MNEIELPVVGCTEFWNFGEDGSELTCATRLYSSGSDQIFLFRVTTAAPNVIPGQYELTDIELVILKS